VNNRDDIMGLNHQEMQKRRELNFKLNLFMIALIFGVISISIQYPINKSSCLLLKLLESLSWICLVFSGYFSLVNVSKHPVTIISRPFEWLRVRFKKDWNDELLMWRLFYLAMFLLLTAKILDKFL